MSFERKTVLLFSFFRDAASQLLKVYSRANASHGAAKVYKPKLK